MPYLVNLSKPKPIEQKGFQIKHTSKFQTKTRATTGLRNASASKSFSTGQNVMHDFYVGNGARSEELEDTQSSSMKSTLDLEPHLVKEYMQSGVAKPCDKYYEQ